MNTLNKRVTKEDWFGVVRWCEEDIQEALRDAGYDDCEENVAVIRRECEHRCFKEGMIETGWHYISCYIQENEGVLVPEAKGDCHEEA